ncbi:MAG: hypothetical protein KAW14_04110 [Candidatus Aegiribacteria sp.]|nr:hypothetical protein [Candidatus Aegiribacteria sp.]
MKPFLSGILLLLILLPFSGQLQACSISGSLKPGIDLIDVPVADSSLRFLSQAPIRLMLLQRLGSIRLDLAYMICPTAGDPALEGSSGGTSLFRIGDLDERIFPSEWKGTESFSLLQNLDRFSIRLRLPFSSITLGRQAIYWGVSKSVSPTDFIAPFQYGTVDTEYRIGVDAIRSTFPIGMMSEMDAGWVFGKDAEFSDSGGWLRGRFYMLQTDATLLTACFRENLMLGGSLNRALGGATGWFELAVVSTAIFCGNTPDENKETFWSASAGMDRSWFNATLYGYLEYHFNSPGTNSSEDYSVTINAPAYTAGNIYLLGRHYLSPGMTWTPMPLLNISGQALINLTDQSAYVTLAAEYNITENITLNAGISRGAGESPSSETGKLCSEFGSWPGKYFTSAACYF